MTWSGERDLVLARLRAGTAAPPPANHAHPTPPADAAAPELEFVVLDDDPDLPTLFATSATEAGCTVHHVVAPPRSAAAPGSTAADTTATGATPGGATAAEAVADPSTPPRTAPDLAVAVADVVARHDVRTAVATDEPEIGPVVAALRAAGVSVEPATDRLAAAGADLGITSCRAAVATTGTVAVGSDVPGARWASLLPRVHLCVVPTDRVAARPGDVLRAFGPDAPPPAGLWFVTGPSRTGDIEQLLTRGVHGPVAVELLLVAPSTD